MSTTVRFGVLEDARPGKKKAEKIVEELLAQLNDSDSKLRKDPLFESFVLISVEEKIGENSTVRVTHYDLAVNGTLKKR